ncbi:hypothetical protein ACQ4PT_060509 [Festuca glaucescens]
MLGWMSRPTSSTKFGLVEDETPTRRPSNTPHPTGSQPQRSPPAPPPPSPTSASLPSPPSPQRETRLVQVSSHSPASTRRPRLRVPVLVPNIFCPDAEARAREGWRRPSSTTRAGSSSSWRPTGVDEEEECFESIDKLISQGINAGDVKKLQDAGIYTCNGLMMHTKKSLTGIKGLSEAKVDKICEAAEKLLSQGFMTGSDLLIKMCLRLFDLLLLILKRKSVVRITTGSQALDELLGGGIETLCITEAFGEFRSGKTQLAHTLCVSTQLPLHMHGGNGKVAYIDTEGTFRPERIVPIAERFGMDANAVLDNIIYARAYTYEHQYNLLLGLAAKMAEEPFRLLIVDSVIALFRVDFSGRGELAERQQKLAQMLSRLTKIAEEFNVAVYITNQVIADPGGGMFITDPKKPAGGHVLAHAATIRLMLRKGKGEQRVCKIFDAPNLPEGEAISFYSKHVYCL